MDGEEIVLLYQLLLGLGGWFLTLDEPVYVQEVAKFGQEVLSILVNCFAPLIALPFLQTAQQDFGKLI